MNKQFKEGDLVLSLDNGKIGKVSKTKITPNELWVEVIFSGIDQPIDVKVMRLVSIKELAVALVEVI